MMRVVLWKEYREQRSVWITLAVVCVAGLLVGHAFLGPASNHGVHGGDMMCVLAGVLVWTCGLVFGAMLLAGESEGGTQTFLDTLPTDRLTLWRAKCLAGALPLGLMVVVVGGVSAWLDVLPPREWPLGAVVLVLIGLSGYGWGLLFSAVTRSVLAAIGLAVLAQNVAGAALGLVFLVLAAIVSLLTGWDGLVAAAPFLAAAVWVLGPLPLSAVVYAWVDRQRHPVPGRINVRMARWWAGWREALRLTWAQTSGLAVGLLLLCLPAGALVAVSFVACWPLFTLGVGALCGATAFLDEQSGAYRFLGDQRFPLGRLWLVKVLVRLALAGLAVLLMLLPAAFVQAMHEGRSDAQLLFGSYLLSLSPSPLGFGIGWLVYGFTVGQLCGLVFRKPLVALVVSMGLAALLVSVWVPSILLGGLRAWQLLSVPLVLLVTAWLVLRAWVSDRLGSRRVLVRLALAGLVCVALTALGLWYRVAEVPNVAAPGDFKAFVADLPAEENNEAGRAVRLACDGLGDLARHRPNVPGGPNYPARCAEVIEQGWPDRDPALAVWLDEVFRREAWASLARINKLPTGVVEDPRRFTYYSDLRYLEPARLAGTLLAARGLQMQAMHDRPEVFIAHFETALALVRNLENGTVSSAAAVARHIEASQFIALDRWLERLPNHADLPRRALAVLRRHIAWPVPGAHEHLLADYLVALRSLDVPQEWLAMYSGGPRGADAGSTELAVLATAASMPWERERQERILRCVHWQPDLAQSRRFFGALLPPLPRTVVAQADTPARRRCRREAAVLKLALRVYQAEKGKPAETLAALVPAYLPAVPADPFDNAFFRYRLSRGEEITWPTQDMAAAAPGAILGPAGPVRVPVRKVLPGQGVLWSVGEDHTDDGGRRRCLPRSRCVPGEDIIYLVPLPAK
jgi:hypothetical protein